MLRPNELVAYFNEHVPLDSARRYITWVRNNPPSRAVSPNSGNVVTAFASTKMERTINTDSRTAEFAYARELEFCEKTHEYWDQPEPVPVTRKPKDGKQWNGSYTADFLVLSNTGAYVTQVKTAEQLELFRAQAHPDWVFREDGPHHVPADIAFELIGLPHVVVSSASIPPRRTANIGLLLRAANSANAVTPALLDRIDKYFRKISCCTISNLAKSLRIVDHTPLLQLIECAHLHVRLSEDSLAHPNTAWIARDARYLDLVVKRVGFVTPTTGSGVVLPSAAAVARAIERKEALARPSPTRTRRRLRGLIRKGKAAGESEFDSLIPNYRARGNRERRMNSIQEEFLRESILRFYATGAQPNVSIAYRQYQVAAETKIPEYRPLSITVFRNYIRQMPPEKIGMGRGGKRMANALTGPSPMETRDLPPMRAFERAAIDHSLLPMYIVLYQKGDFRIPVKAWITALRDVATSFVLAIWLSLNHPSAKTNALLYRRCVRAHGRLPECIYSDNGPDLTSKFNTSFLGHMGVDHARIPVAHPRFDQPIESLFYQMQTGWLPLRLGNVTLGASERGMSSSHKPSKISDMTLKDTWMQVQKFVDWNNDRVVDLTGLSPAERMAASLERYSCSGIKASISNEFVISTAIETGAYKIDPQGGIRIDDRRYYCAALLQHTPARSAVQVRIDPENPHVVYAQVRGAWHTCTASGARMFESLDDIEKLVETTRLLEATKHRKKVREASQRDLVRIINEADAARLEPQNSTTLFPPLLPLVTPRTLFDDVRAMELDSPKAEDDEVFKDVLGK